MKTNTDSGKIDEILTRGVVEFIDPEGSFKKKLQENPQEIIIKLGVDVTRPDIHIGHAIVLRKLRQFQDLGCKVVFIIGDFTTRIGDPTAKSKVRPEIEQQEIENNAKTFVEQVGKILLTNTKVFSWIRNSDWFTSITDLNLPDDHKVNFQAKQNNTEINIQIEPNSFIGKAIVFEKTRMQLNNPELINKVSRIISLNSFLWTLKHITHSRLIERDMFQERIKKGEELYMHEMIYPVLQGIDSFVLSQIYGSCDLEIGGNDQTFNILMGRDVMKMNNQEPQAVMILKMLEGLDGKEKMSKSLDNYIGIIDAPSNMYGKVMSIPDSSIKNYFELATYTPIEELENIKKILEAGKTNPKDLKMRLAREIVAIYHGDKEAKRAEADFVGTFQKGGIPEGVEEGFTTKGANSTIEAVRVGLAGSNSEFRRLVGKGAVTNMETGEKITERDFLINKNQTWKVGKRKFFKWFIKD